MINTSLQEQLQIVPTVACLTHFGECKSPPRRTGLAPLLSEKRSGNLLLLQDLHIPREYKSLEQHKGRTELSRTDVPSRPSGSHPRHLSTGSACLQSSPEISPVLGAAPCLCPYLISTPSVSAASSEMRACLCPALRLVSVAPVPTRSLNGCGFLGAQRVKKAQPRDVQERIPWGEQTWPKKRWEMGRRQTIAHFYFLQQIILRCSGCISLSVL